MGSVYIASYATFATPEYWVHTCDGTCGNVTNADSIRRTFTLVADGKKMTTTVLPHGNVTWDCSTAA